MAVSYWDGKQWIDLASGQQGPPGPAGNGISSVIMNADYTLTINFTNGSSYTTPSIRGEQGEEGEQGPAGADGEDGVGIASVALISGTHAPGTLDTYRITLTDGNTYDFQVYNGADGQGSAVSVAITIAVADWSSKTCTKAVTGVTSSNNIIVSPDPSSFLEYGSAQIRATAQGSGTVTFACETVPAGSIDVNVLILG